MKAYLLPRYGSADVLDLAEIDTPTPGAQQVQIRVRATSINPYDWHNMRGEPRAARLVPGGLGFRAPAIGILGCDVAGQVSAVGSAVTAVKPGDDVYALVEQGGFAEYAVVDESLVARMPGNLTHEEAAAVPMAGVTAMLALREEGGLASGQRVLVLGASGGVGTFAVQIAKAMGAEVTGVCRTGNVDLVRKLGADVVVDYTRQDVSRAGKRYDLVLDIAGSHSGTACRRMLTPSGTYVAVGGQGGRWLQPMGHIIGIMISMRFASQRFAQADAVACGTKRDVLDALTGLIESGQVTPAVHRTYAFDEIPAAVRYQEEGHAPAKVVVTV